MEIQSGCGSVKVKQRLLSLNNYKFNGENMEEKISFEDNMKRLSAITAELEKGDMPLEKAVELYGEGAKLAAVCRKQLDEAKIKITEVGGTAASE